MRTLKDSSLTSLYVKYTRSLPTREKIFMIIALCITVAVVAGTGLALKYLFPLILRDPDWNISWREFIVGLLVAYLVVIPGIFIAGKSMSTADALRYEEFRNGVETSATVNVTTCTPGHSGGSAETGHSNCSHEYENGETYSYLIPVEHSTTSCVKNKCTTSSYITMEPRTGYIYNPYATKEYSYNITDSLGSSHTFLDAYVKDGQGYKGKTIPKDIPRGDPAEWASAKQRLDEGNPRPVTRLFDYNNYVLASHDNLLKPFSQNVVRYLKERILPEHTKHITANPLYGFNSSTADKVSFVGVKVSDPKAWEASMMSFDAALGSKLQGDMHLVLIDSSLVNSPTDYLNALKAYWLGDDLGRRAIAKNAVIVVAGVQGDTIKWGMASTGMPFGNEVMLQGIVNFLPDTPLDPKLVIGDPHTVITPSKNGKNSVAVTISQKPGVLERVVLQDFPFRRACMDCKTNSKQIGYGNLVIDMEPKPWQFGIMIGIVSLLAVAWWFIAGSYEFLNWGANLGSSGRDGENDQGDYLDRRGPYGRSDTKKSEGRRYSSDGFNHIR